MLVTNQESEAAKYLTRGIRLLSVWNISALAGPHAQLDSGAPTRVNMKIV